MRWPIHPLGWLTTRPCYQQRLQKLRGGVILQWPRNSPLNTRVTSIKLSLTSRKKSAPLSEGALSVFSLTQQLTSTSPSAARSHCASCYRCSSTHGSVPG